MSVSAAFNTLASSMASATAFADDSPKSVATKIRFTVVIVVFSIVAPIVGSRSLAFQSHGVC